MNAPSKLTEFGFSQYEAACYLALVGTHPSNGSQLSKLSGIARSRIYDVLRSLAKKGLAFEIETGRYVPLPPGELKKRLRSQFEANLLSLEEELDAISQESDYEYILTLHGMATVIQKAREIIDSAKNELYVRLFPRTGKLLEKHLLQASGRGVGVRYISMGDEPMHFNIQIVHPNHEGLLTKIGGESIDIIADKSEALVGIFEHGREETSRIIWTRNPGFVIANRDSLRHDFYHYFLNRTYDLKQDLNDREKTIYEFIKADE